MKKAAALVFLALALVAMVYSYQKQGDDQLIAQPVETPDVISASPSEGIPVPVVSTLPPEAVPFEIDQRRLYDLSYLVDPDLIAYADSLDVSPVCVVAVARGEATFNDRPVCDLITINAHVLHADNGIEYDRLTMDELMTMADTDPYANQEIGGRYINSAEPDLATRYYERATAISGKATPIMFIRQTDVHPEVLQYELLLVAEALGRKPQPIQRFVATNGLGEDQLVEAEQRARLRLERLTDLRMELVGQPWPALE